MQTLKIRHNMEVAHRLVDTPGKCQQIHGHSMWVVAELEGGVNQQGLLLGMDFGSMKYQFRGELDRVYDHHLLLNKNDPWAIHEPGLPGLCLCRGDPTTENIARWIGEYCLEAFYTEGLERIKIEVWETQTNSATWEEVISERIETDGAVPEHTG